MLYRLKRILKNVFLLIFLLNFVFIYKVNASNYRTNYSVEYFLENSKNSIKSHVQYKINIINLEENLYVNKFSLMLPDTFSISNIQASNDNGNVIPQVTKSNNKIAIELAFSDPKKGINSQNNFFLSFNQSNLFNVNGNVWEVILPIIETKENENYEITVNLPNLSNKKISISKPKPTNIYQNKIYWKNPKTKTIYALFGNSQLYEAKLTYNLLNPKYTKVYTDIAFPPDTENQKIYLKSINPKPDLVYLDKDNNYIGRYIINPKSKIKILYESVIELTVLPRSENKDYIKKSFEIQNKYLLKESDYWKIFDIDKYKNLSSVQDIYYYLVNNFSYDYTKIKDTVKRAGANYALNNTNKVICTEFSDSFIALSREKGIYSREIQGYGFSQNEKIRPLSLGNDVLHSWPQYFDLNQNNWISVDPTWENTSGIDYFTSFDLNHIVFAIHGYKPNYPLPAGMYKQDDSKDISITTSETKPQEIINLQVINNDIPNKVLNNSITNSKISILNKSNVFLYNIPVSIYSDGFIIKNSIEIIPIIAPLEEKNINFSFSSKKSSQNKGIIVFQINKNNVMRSEVRIINTQFYLIIFFATFLSLVIFIILFKKYKSKNE